jgi:hypothetical protein
MKTRRAENIMALAMAGELSINIVSASRGASATSSRVP